MENAVISINFIKVYILNAYKKKSVYKFLYGYKVRTTYDEHCSGGALG